MEITTQLADTYGWDTAYAITLPALNASIAKSNCSPTKFAYEQDGINIAGTFGTWQVCRGGDGKLLHMSIPLPTLTVTSSTTTLNYTGGSCIIEVQLQYLPHTVPGVVATMGTFHRLVVSNTPDPAAPTNPIVTVISLTFPSIDFVTASIVEGVLGGWFCAHIADFAYIFAVVNLNRQADEGQFQWLMPTYTDYAYLDGPTDETSTMGILCMTSDGGSPRSPNGLTEQLSPNAIPAESREGFLISPERFLTQLIWPVMPTMFPGTKQTDYSVDTSAYTLTLNAPVQLQEVENDGSTYTPILTAFTLSLLGQQITMAATTKTAIVLGIDAYAQSTYTYQIGLTTTAGGEPSLNFEAVGSPAVNQWTDISGGMTVTDLIAAIIVAVIGGVLVALTDGAAAVVGGIVVGLLVGAVLVTPDLIATLGTDDAPSVNTFVLNATDPIVWTDEADFAIDYASLNGSLQLGAG